MTDPEASLRLYADLGVKPVINAAGAYTMLGGSAPSASVRAAMEDANRYFVDMRELLTSTGEIISSMLGCEAALVTSGAAAALALGAAALMTDGDPEKVGRLPDATGMKDEIIVQRRLRIRYDRCVTLSGARLVEVGDEAGTTAAELAEAIGSKTLAVHFLATGFLPGALPFEEVLRVAHAHDVPVIVDAAGQTYPLDELRRYARQGADLVCYAAKYFDAPHSTGILCGRANLVRAAMANSFVGFETEFNRAFGRPMKVDRQEIVAVVVALREWLALDHEERFQRYGERADVILRALKDVPGIEAYRISERETPAPVVRDGVRIVFDADRPRKAREVFESLREGLPSIRTFVLAEDKLNVSVAFFADGEEDLVAERLRAALSL